MNHNEDMDAAILAAQTNGALNQWYGPQHQRPRIDPRQFINGGNNRAPQYHHPQNFNHPPQHNNGGFDEYGLPQSIPAQPIQALPMVMRGRDGKLIDLNQVLNLQDSSPSYSQNVENFQGFDVPDYSDNNSKNSKKKNVPQEHPFDIILKEIKSLKRSVNKLIREVESSKVTNSKPNTIDEVTIKSTNISERILDSNIGDE